VTERHTNQLNRVLLILRQLAVSEERQGDQDAAEMLLHAARPIARILDVVDVQDREAATSGPVSGGLLT
jgi:hypothetical protein